MKKSLWIYLALLALAALTLGLVGCQNAANQDYLRLHIRANGDSDAEQAVKLAVRDAVVAYLTPMATKVRSKEEMRTLLSAHLDEVVSVADEVLEAEGYAYRATAYFSREDFPTRTYGELTLEAGVYDALIVELGSGEGANWWCVAFPPLCFVEGTKTGSDTVQYRSAIADWFRRHTDND